MIQNPYFRTSLLLIRSFTFPLFDSEVETSLAKKSVSFGGIANGVLNRPTQQLESHSKYAAPHEQPGLVWIITRTTW